jgi:hypothetical protein
MHDVFKGLPLYDIPLIRSALVKLGYFDLVTLNHRLQRLQYSYHDVGNRPPLNTSIEVDMLPFDAGQVSCITRVRALAFGDLVPETDDEWQFYLISCNNSGHCRCPVSMF